MDPSSFKTNTSKFQFDLERTDTSQRVLMNSLVIRGKQITIYNFFFLQSFHSHRKNHYHHRQS